MMILFVVLALLLLTVLIMWMVSLFTVPVASHDHYEFFNLPTADTTLPTVDVHCNLNFQSSNRDETTESGRRIGTAKPSEDEVRALVAFAITDTKNSITETDSVFTWSSVARNMSTRLYNELSLQGVSLALILPATDVASKRAIHYHIGYVKPLND